MVLSSFLVLFNPLQDIKRIKITPIENNLIQSFKRGLLSDAFFDSLTKLGRQIKQFYSLTFSEVIH